MSQNNEPSTMFRIGQVVRVHSLVAAPQHNDRIGTVIALFPGEGRVGVALLDGDWEAAGRRLKLKITNAARVQCTDDDAAAKARQSHLVATCVT